MNTPTGGPAFPLQSIGPEFEPGYAGMTMRDYFAAKAMAAMISAYPCQAIDNQDGGKAIDSYAISGDAYEISDAMLKVREQK